MLTRPALGYIELQLLRACLAHWIDATLGYTREGPLTHPLNLLVRLTIIFFSADLSGAGSASHGDALRRQHRNEFGLREGHRVTQRTAPTCIQLAPALRAWLMSEGMSFEDVLMSTFVGLDWVNHLLIKYGRFLLSRGKPDNHLSEIISSISEKRSTPHGSVRKEWAFSGTARISGYGLGMGMAREAAGQFAGEACFGLANCSVQREEEFLHDKAHCSPMTMRSLEPTS